MGPKKSCVLALLLGRLEYIFGAKIQILLFFFVAQHDQRLMPHLTAFEYQADYQLTDVSGSPNWYPSVVPAPRVEYQDSPIQWHSNPMYSGLEDLESRSVDYGIQHIWKDSTSTTTIQAANQRSTSRTSIYSTSSSDQEQNPVMLSVLEPVKSRSLSEIEMISNNGTENVSKRD